MSKTLAGKHIAILATDGFEESELTVPQRELQRHGARVDVVSPKEVTVQGYLHHRKSARIEVTVPLSQAVADHYDALVLPGGVMNPDALRINDEAIDFVRSFLTAEKPIAAICHGPWTLINAGGVKGRRITSWPSLRLDLENAGASWVNRDVVVDGRLVTSRNPDDLPVFCLKMIELFAAPHRRDHAG